MFTNKKGAIEMSGKQFKRSLLAVSIMAMSIPTFAQSNNNSADVEEVVVTGMRSSLDSAQELKRNADTVKDVITASDIGALPDKSVTEALQRVAGVTIERFAASDDPNHFADEGTGVLVRGLDRVRSEVNGRDAFSANPWGGLNYEDFSPELLKAVEVVKNQTSDLIAGGIAGTVNLITRKPFDSTDRAVAFSAKASYGDFREEVTPAYSGLFSDRWDTSAGEFGFLIAGSASEFKSRGDGVGVANYYSRGDSFIGSYDAWGGLNGWGAIPGRYDASGNLITEAKESPVDGPALPGQAAGSVVYVPGQFSLRTAENDREREGLTSSLQWQNNDETVVATLEHIYSKASLEWRERVIGTQGQGFDGATRFGAIFLDTAEYPLNFKDDGYLESGYIRANPELPMLNSSRWNYTENTVEDTSFNLTIKPTDRLTASFDYQHVESEQIVHNYGINARVAPGSNASDAYLDLTGSIPKVTFVNDQWTTPGTWSNWAGDNQDRYIGTAMDHEVHSNAESDSVKLDLDYELDGNVWTKVKAGFYYSDKELVTRNTEYSNWGFVNEGWMKDQVDKASPLTAPEAWETVSFADFYNGDVLQGSGGTDFWFPKMELVKNFSQSLKDACGTWNNAPYGSGSPSVQPDSTCYSGSYNLLGRVAEGSPFAPHDISVSGEERTEFYIRGDFAFEDIAVPVKGNVGLRYVSYQLDSSGYVVMPAAYSGSAIAKELFADLYPGANAFADGTASVQNIKGTDYDTVLPSLNLAFQLSDDVIARFGASKGLYFPNLDQTRNTKVLNMSSTAVRENPNAEEDANNPVVDIVNLSLTGSAQNPFLKPEESTNFDLTTEWYFAKAGSLTLGLFYKDLDNIIRQRGFVESVTNNGVTQDFLLSGPANTGSGSLQGIELSYSQFYDMLPGAWSGLGLQLNYTYIDQNGLNDPETGLGGVRIGADGTPLNDSRNSFRAFTGLPLEGYSDQNFNVVGMYEYNDISFRLAYTWRSEYMVTRRDSNEFAPIYTKAAGMLDASLFYNINDSWKVGLEANNLLDLETKTLAQVNQEGKLMESLSFDTDRRFAISVRGSF
jgi:iron complex outermembrane receptor protein